MTWVAFGAALVFGFGVACVVDLPPDGRYTCTVNTDCGGDDYVCTPAGAGPRFCCKPTGAEVCDGQDNDCNGVVDDVSPDPCYSGPAGTAGVGRCRGGTQACADGGSICAGEVVPTPEVCNTADDNCNGLVDDGFDFRSDPNNCGRCGVGCALPLRCEDGGCSIPTETICNDNIDNDGDNATDCADSDCVGQSCGTGCVCKNFGKSETACNDGQDNDNDTATDCADTDCDGGSCGTGCQCLSGGKIETLCNDTLDNDGDGPADCADSDCNGASCGTGCACAGGTKTETLCSDTVDNDGDGLLNCADPDCNNLSCGAGCLCSGGVATETACNDIADNDRDGQADCADSDCNGASCGTGCTCAGGVKTETNCNTSSGDEDGDGLANCADPDCLGKTCRNGKTCQSGGACL